MNGAKRRFEERRDDLYKAYKFYEEGRVGRQYVKWRMELLMLTVWLNWGHLEPEPLSE